MRRLIVGVLLLTATVAAPIALAGPVRVPAPASDFTDGTTCGFAVHVHFTVNGESAITFDDGRVIVTGPLSAQFSANGKSVTLNISGPVTVIPAGNAVMIVGRGVGAGPFLLPDGSTTLAYAAGPATVDPTGGPAVLKHGTFLLDICAALAP